MAISPSHPKTVYDFEWGNDVDGNPLDVARLRGQVLLVTNVASA